MKFDYIIGNPPYMKGLHIKISNICFDILDAEGEFIFIQPAAMYFNKNKKPKQEDKKYKDIIQNYETVVEIVSGDVFEAGFLTSLAITKIKKHQEQNIRKIIYFNKKTYYNVPLEDISFTQIDPKMFVHIRAKLQAFTEKQGSIRPLKDVIPGVVISTIRGNVCQDTGKLLSNFWSIYSPINYRKGFRTTPEKETTLGCTAEQAENVYDYLTKKVPLMGQALYKYSSQTFRFDYIPLVDFNRTYTNDELYEMVGFTPEEIEVVEKVIGDYNPRDPVKPMPYI